MVYCSDKFKEECGVFGVFSKENMPASSFAYYGLYSLQHRGQESAGIVTNDNKNFRIHKGMGLVKDIFNRDSLNYLQGNKAIGHVRYSTTGESLYENAQPFLGNFKFGKIALAHNGNITNAKELKESLTSSGINFESTSDSEIIFRLICKYAVNSLEEGILKTISIIKGSYAVVVLTEDKLVVFRDPMGIRPLCMGKLEESYIVASESCALNCLNAEFTRDIEPGEMVIIDNHGVKSSKFYGKNKSGICAFEYIYFAREDSVIDGINVYNARVRAGEQLYNEKPVSCDIVIGVPESGIAAAIGYSRASKIPYEIGFVKNRYVGRTFIHPYKNSRTEGVSIKLNVLKENVRGKRVVVVDDSLVRGNSSKKIVAELRAAGALEVHFRVASPIVKNYCNLGIDISNDKELLGSYMNEDEIRDIIGADSLGYLSIEGLLKVLGYEKGFCLKCFKK